MEWSEPWDAVRVRVAVSRDIAARLRQLTRQCDPALRSLGVLSVCVGGAGVGSTEVPDNVGDSLSQVSSAVNSRNSSVTGVVQPSLTSGLPSNLRQHPHHPLHHHHQHPPSHPAHHHHYPHHHHNLHHHPQQQQLQQRLQTTAGLQQRVTTVQRTVPSRQLQLQQQQQSQQQQLIHYCEPPAPSGSRPVSAGGTDELLSTTVSPSSGMIVNGVLTHASLPATIAATTTTTKLPVAVRTAGPLSAAAAAPPTALHPTHPSLQRHPTALQRPVSPPPPYPGTAAASSSLAPVDVVPLANPAVAVSSAAIGSPLLVNLLKSDVSPLESVSMAGLTRVSSAVRPSSSTSCSTSSSSSVSVASTAAVTPSALHQQLLRSRLQHPAATTTTATGTCQLPTAPLNVSATSATVMATTTTTTTPHRVYSAHLFQLRRSSGNVGVQIKHSDPLTQQQQQQQLRISQSQYQQQQQNQPQQQCAAMAVSSASLRLQAAGCSVGEAARSCVSVSTATSNTIDSCSGDSVVSGSPLSQATSTCSTGTAGRLSSSTPALTSSNSALPVVLSTPYFSTPSSSSSISSAVSSQPTVKPCQLLINPLTGLLEPMAPSDDSESELELPVSQLDVAAAGSFPSSSLSSSVSTCGVVSVSTCLPLCATPAAAASSSFSSVAATTVVGGGTACSGNDAGDFRVRLKHDKLSATTTTLAYDTALTESTPASLAVAALSAGCMGAVPMLNGSDSLLARSGGDPEQRVPPLHISLRGGRNAAIVVTTKDTPTPPNSTASCTAAASFHTNTAVTCSSTIVNAVGTPHLQHHQQHHQQSTGRGGKSRSVSRVLCASESVSCGIDGTNSAPGAGKSSVSIGVSVCSVSPVSHVAVSGGSAAAVRNRCVRDKVKRQKKREEDDSGAADQPQQQQRRLLSCRVVDSLVESRMPATNHVLDLHSDLDLKHVPPMPPEDIFSPDVWMTPGQSSDDVAAQQRFAADNTLCVKTSIPIASADRTTTTATAITSLSTALMSSKHTDLSTVSTCALTPAVVSTVARVTAPVSASSAATAVAGGGGDDSGIESMDTQSEESPNQGESPQHRKEELDSEKHEGVLSRELHLLARRSASIDELDLPVSSTQRRSVVVTTPASPNSSTARISSSPSTSTVVLNGPSNDISLSSDRLSPAMVQLSRDSRTPQASVSSAPAVNSPALSALLSLPLVPTSLAPSRFSAVSARPDSVASSTASEPVCVGRLQTVSVWHDSCTTTDSTTDSLSPTPPVSAVAATNKLATSSDRLMNSPQDASTTLAASAAVGLLHTNVSTYASVGCSSGDQSRSVATSQCFRTLVDTDDRSATLQDTLDAADDAVSDGNGQFSGVVASVECDATTISTDTTTTTTTTAANAGSDVCTRVETPVADSIAVSSKVESIGGEPATCIENNSSSSSTSVISGEFCLVSQPAGTAAISGAVPPASTINCSPSIGVSRGFTALSVGGSACGSPVPPLTLPPGVKMLPIKLIKAPTVVASAGTVARSVSVSLPASTTTSSVLSASLLPLVTSATCSRVDLSLVSTVSAAPSNITSSSALTTDGADSGCTENNSSSNSTRSSSSGCVSVSSRSSTAPVADCAPPSSLSSTEPELLRVQPPLYTYSNVERIQRSASPAEATLFLSERVADVNPSSSSSSSSSSTTTTSSATTIADTAVVDSVSTTCRSVTPGECSDTAAAVSATTTPDTTAATSTSPATTSSSISSTSTVISTVSTTASSLEPLQSGDVDRRCTRSTTSRLHCVTTTTTAAVAMSVAVSSRASNARALRSHTDTLANCIDGSTIATAVVTAPTAITTTTNNSNGDSDLRCRSPSMVVGGGDSPITAASVVVNRSTAEEDGSTPVRTQVNGSVSTVPAVPLFSVRPTVTNSAGRGAKRDVGAALGSSDDTDRPNTRSVGDQSGVIPTSSSSSSCTPATNSSASTGNSGSTSSSGVGENDSNSHLSNCSSLAADSDHSCKPAATDSTTTTSSSCLPDDNNCDHQPMSAVVGVRQNSAASCDSVVLEQTALAPNDNHVDTGVSGQARNNNSTKSSTAIGRLSRAKARGAKFAAVSSDSFLAPTPPAPPPPPTAAVSVAPAPVPLLAATAVTRRGRALLARKQQQQQQLQLGGEEVGSEDVVVSGGVSSASAVVPGKRKLRNNSQLPVVVANHSLDSVAEVHLSAKRRRSSRDK